MSVYDLACRSRKRKVLPRAFLAGLAILILTAAMHRPTLAASAAAVLARVDRAVAQAPLEPNYPGIIGLEIDVSDLDHKIMTVHQTLPVTPGHLVLLYPQWIPGSHSPIGNTSRAW